MNRRALIPWLVTLSFLAGLFAGGIAPPKPSPGDYRLDLLAKIPVSGDGRVKPFDTVARTSLMLISGRQDLVVDGKTYPAIKWLIDVIARPATAAEYPVFRIDNPDVLALIGKNPESGQRFSFSTIIAHAAELDAQRVKAEKVRSQDRNLYQKKLLELISHLEVYRSLRDWETPYAVAPLDENQQWQPLSTIAEQYRPLLSLAQATRDRLPWPIFLDNVLNSLDSSRATASAKSLTAILSAYATGNPDEFNRQVEQYAATLQSRLPVESRKASFEVLFNHWNAFYKTIYVYGFAFVIAAVGLLLCSASPGWSNTLRQTAVSLLLLGMLVHSGALASRLALQARPPVTNLYSSAVFMGWGCVLLALILEGYFKLGLGALAGSIIGLISLIIAHNLGTDGDTMEMMRAVLDSNFWLATHVTAVTIGYSCTFLAGILAICYILLGIATPLLRGNVSRNFGKMVYGVVCFAMFFSFVGTVLGGIWADQSWGRFWGWDPKENGAVLVVLINALILHARWGRMVRDRGVMVLAVAGNIVTAWSWFGTNMLGVGLHSYGFMDSAFWWLVVFVLSQLAIMLLGMLTPPNMWQSRIDQSPSSAED